MADNIADSGWGCNDFQVDQTLKLLNGDVECEHYVIGACYMDGRENFGEECPYRLKRKEDNL